jgi:hypothetical protein
MTTTRQEQTMTTASYHSIGYASHVLYSLAVHGGHRTNTELGAVNLIYTPTLVEHGLAVTDDTGCTLTEKGWEWFRDGTGYRPDWYGPGLVKGEPVSS